MGNKGQKYHKYSEDYKSKIKIIYQSNDGTANSIARD